MQHPLLLCCGSLCGFFDRRKGVHQMHNPCIGVVHLFKCGLFCDRAFCIPTACEDQCALLLLFRQRIGVNGAAEYHEPVEEVLQNKVCDHVENGHQVFVPKKRVRQIAAE